MIIRRDATRRQGWWLIPQPSHARLSARLLQQLGRRLVDIPEPFEELRFAVEHHDIGWLAWEAEPQWNPGSGLPYDFLQMPGRTHYTIWQNAANWSAVCGRYASLLIVRHVLGLFAMHERKGEQAASFQRDIRRREERLQSELADDPVYGPVMASGSPVTHQRLISSLDHLSLQLCTAHKELKAEVPLPGQDGGTVGLRVEETASGEAYSKNSGVKPGGREGAGNSGPAGEYIADKLPEDADRSLHFRVQGWPFAEASLALGCDAFYLDSPAASEGQLQEKLSRAPTATLLMYLEPA